LHLDNAGPRTARTTLAFSKSHRNEEGASSGLFTSSRSIRFYLFGNVHIALMSAKFEGERDFFDGVMDVLKGIPHDELEAVSDAWVM
jgi:hypothetical protein